MHIHEKYQILAQFMQILTANNELKVLKTDCWNEAEKYCPIADYFNDIKMVEISKERIEKAKDYNVVEGDIRKLSFNEQEFDLVLDFSTIDHVPDYEKAISEYHRVLKNGGYALIVSWFGVSDYSRLPHGDNWDEMQYYFDFQHFMEKIEGTFNVILNKTFTEFQGERFLHWFICQKNRDALIETYFPEEYSLFLCHKQIFSLKAQLEEKDQTLASLYASPSWQITRPLRQAMDIFRKLRKYCLLKL